MSPVDAIKTSKRRAINASEQGTREGHAKSLKADDSNTVTLKTLCTVKVDPYDARVKRRAIDPKEYPELAKAHKPKKA